MVYSLTNLVLPGERKEEMMKRVENRKVTVTYCDGCNAEASYTCQCAVCKREYCMEDGGKKHIAYSIELFRYGDSARLNSHICTTCASRNLGLTVGELLDFMMKRRDIPVAA